MNPSEQEGPLRDVVGLLEQWRGRKADCHVWDALTNSSIAAFRATIGDLEIEPDRDDAEARVEVHFKEPGHLLVLYSRLVDSVTIEARRIDLQYRGGNLEIAVRNE